MRPADEQLGGDDRADAGLIEQLRCERLYVDEQFPLELSRFGGRGFDPAGEAAQHEPGRELVGAGGACLAQSPAAVEQLPTGSPRSSWRSGSGAVTITARSCVSASRRTSTALRRATSRSRNVSRRSPVRGSASVSAASAARAVRAASRLSSLPRSRRSVRGVRLTSSTLSPRSLRKRVNPAP